MKYLLFFIALLMALAYHKIHGSSPLRYKKGSCPSLQIPFGRVKVVGVLAKFVCKGKYKLYGNHYSICIEGKWSNAVPACAVSGCKKPPSSRFGGVFIKNIGNGAVFTFSCPRGKSMVGKDMIFCKYPRKWSSYPPTCTDAPKTSCDFEKDMCGWTHSPNDAFSWMKRTGKTPTGGTGPLADHTFKNNTGHYMYIESSAPRKPGDYAQLLSPLYSPVLGFSKVSFWYHMNGKYGVGTLRLYLTSNTSDPHSFKLLFEKSGDQGNAWLYQTLELKRQKNPYRLVFEAVRSVSHFSDIAIDDVKLEVDQDTTTVQTNVDSLTTQMTGGLGSTVSETELTSSHPSNLSTSSEQQMTLSTDQSAEKTQINEHMSTEATTEKGMNSASTDRFLDRSRSTNHQASSSLSSVMFSVNTKAPNEQTKEEEESSSPQETHKSIFNTKANTKSFQDSLGNVTNHITASTTPIHGSFKPLASTPLVTALIGKISTPEVWTGNQTITRSAILTKSLRTTIQDAINLSQATIPSTVISSRKSTIKTLNTYSPNLWTSSVKNDWGKSSSSPKIQTETLSKDTFFPNSTVTQYMENSGKFSQVKTKDSVPFALSSPTGIVILVVSVLALVAIVIGIAFVIHRRRVLRHTILTAEEMTPIAYVMATPFERL